MSYVLEIVIWECHWNYCWCLSLCVLISPLKKNRKKRPIFSDDEDAEDKENLMDDMFDLSSTNDAKGDGHAMSDDDDDDVSSSVAVFVFL